MTHRSARSLRGSLFVTMSVAAFMLGGVAHAQQPPAAAPAKPAAKPAPKAAPAPAAKPAQAPAAPQQPVAQGPGQADIPPMVYSAWTKLCSTPGQNGQDANSPKVCSTMRDGSTETGIPLVSTALIEPDGAKKIFRVTIPAPLALQFGSRIIVDSNEPNSSPFVTCMGNACVADYEGTPELITKLKKGQTLSVQAVNLAGTPISFPVPLAEFAKANEGPPTDLKQYEEYRKKLAEEMQKKADDLKAKLQQQGQTPANR